MIESSVVKNIKKELMQNEKVEMTARQRRIGPGGSLAAPTSITATSNRLIVTYRVALGFKTVHEVIPYNRLTTVRLERGVFSSTIHLHVLGLADQQVQGSSRVEEEFTGLNHKDASELANFLNKKISNDIQDKFNSVEDYTYCPKCGAKVAPIFVYCPRCGTKLGT